MKVVDQSRLHVLIPNFADVSELATQLRSVRDAMTKKAKDRRYLKIFQTQFLEVLQKCQKLKQRAEQRDSLSE